MKKQHIIMLMGMLFVVMAWASGFGQQSSERQMELGLHVGYALTAMNDVNEGIERMKDTGLDQKRISGGPSLGTRFHSMLNDQYALILGVEYLNARTNKTVKIPYTSETSPEILSWLDMKHLISCTLISVQTGIAYRKPFDSWTLYLKGALNYYHATLKESGTTQISQQWAQDYKYERKADANGFGFEITLNPVYMLSDRWRITAEAGYRLARISNMDSDFVSDNFTLDFSGLFFNAGFLFAL